MHIMGLGNHEIILVSFSLKKESNKLGKVRIWRFLSSTEYAIF